MNYDIIVIGAGHAGCEAALAAARLGAKTILITISPDTIAAMSCNPAIGGPAAKSHLVRELDALGGEMGKVIDHSYLNIRKLNESRGPAVSALRAQADKRVYQSEMILRLERQENLSVKQGIVTDLLVRDGKVSGVVLKSGRQIEAGAVILATGTFLGGQIVMGNSKYPGGRQGEPSASELSESLKQHGLKLRRFQTATPPRIHKRSIDFSRLSPQPLKEPEWGFSWDGLDGQRPQEPCWLTFTTPETIRVIQDHLQYSPIQSGSVTGKGPKFCPSIDRKVLRFSEKTDHMVFLEPEGRYTEEVYLLGLTTAMPEWVQEKILTTIPGLEHAEIIRSGYAVEYDCLESFQFYPSLESKTIQNLFTAGQINGTSGYEEAAVQGVIAGINAVRKLQGQSPFVPSRTESYIGVLIDDLVTKGTDEPYRMMTSLAEFRLFLRLDNSLARLGGYGRQLGLINENQWNFRASILHEMEIYRDFLNNTRISSGSLIHLHYHLPERSFRLCDLILRPEITDSDILNAFPETKRFPSPIREYVWNDIRLKGYLDRQYSQIKEMKEHESILIPAEIDYRSSRFFGISRLTETGIDKLEKIKPRNLGQALRIPGLAPEDKYLLTVNFSHFSNGSGVSNGTAV